MNPDLALPIIASLAWLIVAGASLASFRLGWGQLLRMGLLWIAIFGAIFLVVEWFMLTRDAASVWV